MAAKKQGQEEKPLEIMKGTGIALMFLIIGSVIVENLSTLPVCTAIVLMLAVFTQRWARHEACPPEEEVSRWIGGMFWVIHRLTIAVTILQLLELGMENKWYQTLGCVTLWVATYIVSAKFAAMYWKPVSLTESRVEVN